MKTSMRSPCPYLLFFMFWEEDTPGGTKDLLWALHLVGHFEVDGMQNQTIPNKDL